MKIKGFTIVELMVLVVLIAVIVVASGYTVTAYLSVPPQNYESSAIGWLRTVVGSQAAFYSVEGGYASTWQELRDDPIAAGKPAYLDINLSESDDGYNYTLTAAGDSLTGTNGTTVYTDFTCTAVPIKYQEGSKRSFFVDSSGVIRYEYGKPASKESEPI